MSNAQAQQGSLPSWFHNRSKGRTHVTKGAFGKAGHNRLINGMTPEQLRLLKEAVAKARANPESISTASTAQAVAPAVVS